MQYFCGMLVLFLKKALATLALITEIRFGQKQ